MKKNEVFDHRPTIGNGQFYLTLLQMGEKKSMKFSLVAKFLF
jgi:hypothetical protein